MTRRLIINADDFGLSEGVNRGIVECFRKGVLTSTTILVNMPGFDDAVRQMVRNPSLPVGLHLSIVRGAPLSPPEMVKTLVGPDGGFKGLGRLFVDISLRLVSRDELLTELRAQVRKALRAGFRVTHFDSHRHIHLHPFVMDAVVALGDEFGIRRVRTTRVLTLPGTGPSMKERLISRYSAACRAGVLAAGPMATNDYYADPLSRLSRSSGMAPLEAFVKALPEGVVELGCHPGYNHGISVEGESSHDRERDMRFLMDGAFKEILHRHGVALASYRDIAQAAKG